MAFARYARARIKGKIHGQEYVNVLHFGTNENPADFAALQLLLLALGNAILQCAISQLLGATSSDFTLEEVDVQQIFPELTDPVIAAAPAGSVGLRGTINVSFESVMMRLKTGHGGKSKRGRNFLPPPGDADVVNSLLIAGDAQNFYSGFVACMAGKFIGPSATEDFRLGVLSRKILQTTGDFHQAFTEGAQLAIEQTMSSMNSRKVGAGG